MQNCSKYVIFIDSIILKREKSYNFALLYIFLQKFISELFWFNMSPKFSLAKFPKINSLLSFLYFELDKKT